MKTLAASALAALLLLATSSCQKMGTAGMAFLDAFDSGETIFAPIVWPIQAFVNSPEHRMRQARRDAAVAEAEAARMYPASSIRPNAYGPGVHADEYGRPVRMHVRGGVPGEMLRIQPNAYGLGVHMDQYGRPVQAVPAW